MTKRILELILNAMDIMGIYKTLGIKYQPCIFKYTLTIFLIYIINYSNLGFGDS